MRAPQIDVAVPPVLLDAVRTSLLELYQVCADALNHEATRHLRAGDSLVAVHARRDELAALDRMLGQAGWPGEPVTGDPVVLSATAERLREAIWVSLSRAASDLEEACREYLYRADPTELRERLRAVGHHIEMLEQVEAKP